MEKLEITPGCGADTSAVRRLVSDAAEAGVQAYLRTE